MRHSPPQHPQFYVTEPQDCPYLENKVERKLFTALYGSNSNRLNNSLSKQDLEDHKMSYTGLPVQIVLLACLQEYQVKTLVPLNRKKEF